MNGRKKAAMVTAGITAGAVLLPALIAGIAHPAARADALVLLRRCYAGLGGAALLLAAVGLLLHRAPDSRAGERDGGRPVSVTAVLLIAGIVLVLLACLIDRAALR